VLETYFFRSNEAVLEGLRKLVKKKKCLLCKKKREMFVTKVNDYI
jgi:hypothetical protein